MDFQISSTQIKLKQRIFIEKISTEVYDWQKI